MDSQRLQALFTGSNVVRANDHGSQALVVGPLRHVLNGRFGCGVNDKIGFQRHLGGELECLGSLVDGHGWMAQSFEELDAERS